MSSTDNKDVIREVIMPALGMTQDSGEIVAWHKQVGDTVNPDDILMEIETDKTTMEVEAGFTGYVAEIRAAAGTSVAVGETIAVLSESQGDVDSSTRTLGTVATGASAASETMDVLPETATQENAALSSKSKPVVAGNPESTSLNKVPVTDVVLASPKAKLAAHQQGVSLTRLLRRGVEQPIQLADLSSLPAYPSGSSGARSQLQAKVAALRFSEFIVWAQEVSAGSVSASSIWCLFATAALRHARQLTSNDVVSARCESWVNRDWDMQSINADAVGLLGIDHVDDLNTPDLLVRDMTGTALVGYQPIEHESSISLSVVSEGDESLLLSLSFDEDEFDLAQALIFLKSLGERLEQPLRHLL